MNNENNNHIGPKGMKTFTTILNYVLVLLIPIIIWFIISANLNTRNKAIYSFNIKVVNEIKENLSDKRGYSFENIEEYNTLFNSNLNFHDNNCTYLKSLNGNDFIVVFKGQLNSSKDYFIGSKSKYLLDFDDIPLKNKEEIEELFNSKLCN